jgi:hypothetical protein
MKSNIKKKGMSGKVRGTLGDSRLHQRPIDGKGAAASHQDYCRASVAGAVQMQLAAAEVD